MRDVSTPPHHLAHPHPFDLAAGAVPQPGATGVRAPRRPRSPSTSSRTPRSSVLWVIGRDDLRTQGPPISAARQLPFRVAAGSPHRRNAGARQNRWLNARPRARRAPQHPAARAGGGLSAPRSNAARTGKSAPQRPTAATDPSRPDSQLLGGLMTSRRRTRLMIIARRQRFAHRGRTGRAGLLHERRAEPSLKTMWRRSPPHRIVRPIFSAQVRLVQAWR